MGCFQDGLDFDELSRTLSGTPTAEMAPTEYTYTVTDAAGSTASLTFTIEVRSAAALLAFSALKALYDATSGGSWTNNANWDTTMVPTEAELRMWYGLTLADDGWLTKLSLASNNLDGTIPDALGSLDSLESLDLYNNFIRGSIPGVLGKLTSLRYLVLGSNTLSDSIPSELGQLAQLERLDLRDNSFTGVLPLSLTNLTNLQYFHFEGTEPLCPARCGISGLA